MEPIRLFTARRLAQAGYPPITTPATAKEPDQHTSWKVTVRGIMAL